MAFNSANLTQLAHGNGFALWHYTSADAIATVNSAGYYNDAADMLSVRDVIIVVDSNTPTTHFVNVLSNTGTVVDVSDGTAIVETDGD
tara:strand:- start:3447 stop:3710 length:264 start_codon:yes stop_codon:yes gene_type:complete